MNLFLHITLVENSLDLIPVNHNAPKDHTVFDLDNFSDDLVISTALRAIKESDVIQLQIEAKEEGAKLGGVLKVFNILAKHKGGLQVHFNGPHKQIENMLRRLPLS